MIIMDNRTGTQMKVKIGSVLRNKSLWKPYHISSVIRQKFFSFQNNPKNIDPSYKMDLDLWDCLGRVKLIAKFLGLI